LPEGLKEKCLNLFKLIDSDRSSTIDKEETLKYWETNFPKLNSFEIFENVDLNGDGLIQINEWIEFWTKVYNSGYKEREISQEV
jgi:Ca2+-binding EF-hand superfamily protein